MLRMESESGWWLVTHPDHAQLAGAFATAWGNEQFRKPEPRDRVLYAITSHDDGWAERDAHPSVTKEGKPSAFSTELVGKYSAFEEIDLAEYLAVRERAVKVIAEQDPYAGLLVAIHTNDLLTNRADRWTIAADQLPLLDRFLEQQAIWRQQLITWIQQHPLLEAKAKEAMTIREHFQLLQACDNLSLLACVGYQAEASLLHPLPLNDGGKVEVRVEALGLRHFRLDPWPFAEAELSVEFPARHVRGKRFESSEELEAAFVAAPVEKLKVTISA